MTHSIRTLAAALMAFILGCQDSPPGITDVPTGIPAVAEHGAPVPFRLVDDNVKHDTLLIQVTFDLGDGTHLMVASHMEETFEGLRLYHYKARPDSTPHMLAVSSPAYESWTMLPTFFHHPLDSGTYVLLTNWGERESWGQKVFAFDEQGFHDLCFLDVAHPVQLMDEDGVRRKLMNVGPYVRCMPDGEALRFTFACDSVYLYDDLAGTLDSVVPAPWVEYSWSPAEGLLLWYQGEARKPRPI
jgi:hypothetical protein